MWAYHDELAVLLFYDNRLEDARPYWEQVTRLSPDNPVGYNGLGLIDMWSGRFAESERFLRLSLDKQPNVIGHRNLAYIRLQLGDYAGALEQVAAAGRCRKPTGTRGGGRPTRTAGGATPRRRRRPGGGSSSSATTSSR